MALVTDTCAKRCKSRRFIRRPGRSPHTLSSKKWPFREATFKEMCKRIERHLTALMSEHGRDTVGSIYNHRHTSWIPTRWSPRHVFKQFLDAQRTHTK